MPSVIYGKIDLLKLKLLHSHETLLQMCKNLDGKFVNSNFSWSSISSNFYCAKVSLHTVSSMRNTVL